MGTHFVLRRALACVAVLAVGCGGDDGSPAESEATGSTGTASGNTDTDTDAPTGSSTSSGGADTFTVGLPETDDAGETDDSDTNIDATLSGGSSSSSGGDAPACAELDETACGDEAACEPITGQPFVENGGGTAMWCLDPAEFIGCRAADAECGEVISHACEEVDGTVHQLPNDCIPDGWSTCDPPAKDAEDCA